MAAIWKFQLAVVGRQVLMVPEGPVPLCVQVQRGQPCLWLRVDPSKSAQPYTVLVVGTGHEREDIADALYVGSFQLHDGDFVGHVFVERAK